MVWQLPIFVFYAIAIFAVYVAIDKIKCTTLGKLELKLAKGLAGGIWMMATKISKLT